MHIFIPRTDRLYRLMRTFLFKSFNQHEIYRSIAGHWGGQLIREPFAYTHWEFNIPAGINLRFMQIRSSWQEIVRIGIYKKDNATLPITIGNIYTSFELISGMEVEAIETPNEIQPT